MRMAQGNEIHSDINRRLRQFSREIAGTVLLTLAALGFLVAAIYGGGISPSNDADVVDPVKAWKQGPDATR